MESKRIRVLVRFRPLLSREKDHSTVLIRQDVESNSVTVRCTTSSTSTSNNSQSVGSNPTEKVFTFDGVLDGLSTQSTVYHKAKVDEMIDGVLQGYNATIMCYGQTSSGKTYSMEGYNYFVSPPTAPHDVTITGGIGKRTISRHQGRGARHANVNISFQETSDADLGILPRTIKSLFQKLKDNGASDQGLPGTTLKRRHVVKCSFYQIYNEKAFDLFNEATSQEDIHRAPLGLRMRWNVDQGFHLENLFENECESYEEAIMFYKEGLQRKIMASHGMNDTSSRSHCIFTLTLESSDRSQPSDHWTSRMTLVDLAGSERQRDTKAVGVNLKESIYINKSLVVLRRVIQSLCSSESSSRLHAPYRDSMLTSLLKQSLEGNSNSVILACLSPSDSYVEENLSTLTYASQAQCIVSKPRVNETAQMATIRQLKAEVMLLRQQLKSAQDFSSLLSAQKEGNSSTTCTCVGITKSLDPGAPSASEGGGEVERLKSELWSNIELIKRMFSVEQTLRSRLEDEEQVGREREVENRSLTLENLQLRERIEMLESVVLQQQQRQRKEEEEEMTKGDGLVSNQVNLVLPRIPASPSSSCASVTSEPIKNTIPREGSDMIHKRRGSGTSGAVPLSSSSPLSMINNKISNHKRKVKKTTMMGAGTEGGSSWNLQMSLPGKTDNLYTAPSHHSSNLMSGEVFEQERNEVSYLSVSQLRNLLKGSGPSKSHRPHASKVGAETIPHPPSKEIRHQHPGKLLHEATSSLSYQTFF